MLSSSREGAGGASQELSQAPGSSGAALGARGGCQYPGGSQDAPPPFPGAVGGSCLFSGCPFSFACCLTSHEINF